MEVIPSIDLRGGYGVRLYQGDYGNETVFSEDPVQTALHWQSLGAPRLHIVDLDGAATGEIGNSDIINTLATAMLIPTQLGGGIRDIETVERLLKAGIERIILGTAAVENPQLVEAACKKYRDSIIVGIDTREGMVAVRGWREETKLSGIEFARQMAKLGVRRFILTDIIRDGTLTEPNFTAISEFITEVGLPVIAAGGVTSIEHLRILEKLGAEGAIIGKALYTGDLDLKKALAEIR
ncbi:1-(5-phosphoribosyl)-5-[(5-phosphoribosylamino)methylideneamino]imidazole-4-carboxamide isomerase [Chloroflexota bacterium]